MKYYLYRHIRLDKNEPFYIGIGKKDNKNHRSEKTEYLRAYNKTDRNNWWKKVVSKTEYEVEIILESDNYKVIKQKEIEFIALYGRRDLEKGTLVNMTDGGDGILNVSFSSRQKQSQKKKGKNNPQWGKKGELSTNFGKSSWLKGLTQTKEHVEKRLENIKSSNEILNKNSLFIMSSYCLDSWFL